MAFPRRGLASRGDSVSPIGVMGRLKLDGIVCPASLFNSGFGSKRSGVARSAFHEQENHALGRGRKVGCLDTFGDPIALSRANMPVNASAPKPAPPRRRNSRRDASFKFVGDSGIFNCFQ